MSDSNNMGEKVSFETKSAIEYIKDNWKDDFGAGYIHWLEETLEKIRSIEKKRELIHLKAEKIKVVCTMISSSDGDSPKELKLTLY